MAEPAQPEPPVVERVVETLDETAGPVQQVDRREPDAGGIVPVRFPEPGAEAPFSAPNETPPISRVLVCRSSPLYP